jgi:uncharacterized protein (DUF58 family)
MEFNNNNNNNNKPLVVDYVTAINSFSNAFSKLPLKKILYRNLLKGRGVEFDSYRDFESDDDASTIDWMASLRAHSLIAKRYVEERDLHIYFLIDVSNSMLFGSSEKLKAEYTAEFVLALSHFILDSGDRVSLLLYNDDVVKYIPPGLGKKHFFLLLNTLLNSENYGGLFSIDKPSDFLLNLIKSNYNLFILVSDFIGFSKKSETTLKKLSANSETIAVLMRDPLDETLPKNCPQLMISDPYSDKQILVDTDLAREIYEESVLKQKNRLKSIFLRSNIDSIDLNICDDFYLPFFNFLKSRTHENRI